MTLYVHYSISRLPETGYQPRLADDRVGHFLTVIKDFSKTGGDDQFVRYVNRWDLRKAEPSAEVSPPATPIIFWIEKTVPFKYRGGGARGDSGVEQGVRAGGVRQRHRGPPAARRRHLGPRGHQLQHLPLDHLQRRLCHGTQPGESADRPDPRRRHHLRRRFPRALDAGVRAREPGERAVARTAPPGMDESAAAMRGASASPLAHDDRWRASTPAGMAQQLAFGAMALAAGGKPPAKEQIEKLIMRGREVHRHPRGGPHAGPAAQLQGQRLLDDGRTQRPGEDPQRRPGRLGDGLPAGQHRAQGQEAGRLLQHARSAPTTTGPSNTATSRLPGGTEGEVAELAKIASRGTEPALQYATDEDARGSRPRSAGQSARPEHNKFRELNVPKQQFPHNELPKSDNDFLAHCHGMLDKMEIFIQEGRMDKVFRWLGFIQGCLWRIGVYTVEEMKNHSRP